MKTADNVKVKRRSNKRESIIELLSGCILKHPTADEIYNYMRQKYPKISLGTVYRNLRELSENGTIRKISAPNKADRYDAVLEPHIHFLCLDCGNITDIKNLQAEKIIVNDLKKTRFCAQDISISVSGICPHCCKNKRF